ncbi:putative signal peptide protein [hydrocarbon metagenome]|uniref:Putative signal peptide protein n=1 Tax=hydrocarbon metagenome TaxID=938273 RepID=A0A0W8FMR7_9ZZZZ
MFLCGFAESLPCEKQTSIYPVYKDESSMNAENNKQAPVKTSLHSLSLRARFSSFDVIGDVAEEEFWEYDLAAYFRSPWKFYTSSGWGADVRLMSSIGVLYGDSNTALVISLIPLLAFGSQDGKFTLDMGAGGALLSRHKFGTQDYGGYFQFALTAGVSIPLFWQLGAGYRYLHYSDAAIYGPHNTGADFHMLELIYRF